MDLNKLKLKRNSLRTEGNIEESYNIQRITKENTMIIKDMQVIGGK